jgi:hypothetical protein
MDAIYSAIETKLLVSGFIKHVDLYYGQIETQDNAGGSLDLPFKCPAVFVSFQDILFTDTSFSGTVLLRVVSNDLRRDKLGPFDLAKKVDLLIHNLSGASFEPLKRLGASMDENARNLYVMERTYSISKGQETPPTEEQPQTLEVTPDIRVYKGVE